ncbi:MAG: hypothetical protein A3K75_03640 [Euryarchaeota archaeon RBG_13_61_15]|nr:MAG: hypothetical protein A3K75_03640 [Euryarchaeota archaeon RBG_13_61_15]
MIKLQSSWSVDTAGTCYRLRLALLLRMSAPPEAAAIEMADSNAGRNHELDGSGTIAEAISDLLLSPAELLAIIQ